MVNKQYDRQNKQKELKKKKEENVQNNYNTCKEGKKLKKKREQNKIDHERFDDLE